LEPNSYALVGCTVAPGFDFTDFELAHGAKLSEEYPAQAALIKRLTRI
jgi:predicted cupin superfamily sugar epimerase